MLRACIAITMGHDESKLLTLQHALLFASAMSASGSTLCRRMAMTKFHPLQFEAITGITHAIIGACCLMYAIHCGTPRQWSLQGFGWTVGQSALSCISGVTFMFMIRPGSNIGIASAATSTCVTVSTLLMTSLFLGETLCLRSVTGVILMLVGLFIAIAR